MLEGQEHSSQLNAWDQEHSSQLNGWDQEHSSPGLKIILDGMHLTLTVAWPAFAASNSLLLLTFKSILLA